jgi:hypothetical protein
VGKKKKKKSECSEAPSRSGESSGRLVWNHSTHLEGLIPILEKLTTYEGVSTVTPGVIGRVKSHMPHMKLKVSVPIRGGFKLIARQGKTVQEVFIVTSLSQGELEEAIATILCS